MYRMHAIGTLPSGLTTKWLSGVDSILNPFRIWTQAEDMTQQLIPGQPPILTTRLPRGTSTPQCGLARKWLSGEAHFPPMLPIQTLAVDTAHNPVLHQHQHLPYHRHPVLHQHLRPLLEWHPGRVRAHILAQRRNDSHGDLWLVIREWWL